SCPPNPDPTTGVVNPALPYNPYITVDYAENVTLNDGLRYTDAADRGAAGVPGWPTRFSWGRYQPYAANNQGAAKQWVKQTPNPPPGGTVRLQNQTFYRMNGIEPTFAAYNPATANQTLKNPFDWLVHLDRPAISPMELLHVSAYKPHELTQQFVD